MSFLTAPQVAEHLAISARKVYELHASGALPGYRFGRSVRFERTDLDSYLERCRTLPPAAVRAKQATPARSVKALAGASELERLFRRHCITPRLEKPTSSAKRRGQAGKE